MSDFQQILLRDLPLSPGTASPYTFVAVDGNRNSVRVPASVLTNSTVVLAPSAPAALSSPGTEGSLAFSCPSLYSYYNGQWGASPRYTKNIGDLDANTRFLLVNRTMNLTAEEKAAVKSSLGIAVASTDEAGLVFGSAPEKEGMVAVTVEDGHMYVRNATAVDNGVVTTTGEDGPVTTKEYVDAQIEGLNRELIIPVATTGKIGGVLSGGDGDIFTVSDTGAVSIREATNSVPGIVTVASANDASQLESVVPLKLMRSVIEDITAGTVPYATYTSAGIVRPAGNVSGSSGALYFPDATNAPGVMDVYVADANRRGVVKLATTIPAAAGQDDPIAVPNTKAVRDYVQTILTGDDDDGGGGGAVLSPSSIPKATTGSIGGIMVGSRLTINSAGLLNVTNASTYQYGAVKLKGSFNAKADADESTTVPTAQAVRNYVTSVALGGDGGTVDPVNLPKATASTLGAIRIGNGININDSGVASIAQASTSTIGGVRVDGSIFTVNSGGNLSIRSASTGSAGIVQLVDSYGYTTSTTTAPTAAALRRAYDELSSRLRVLEQKK